MTIKTLLFTLAVICSCSLAAQNENPELPAVKETLRYYLDGGAQGDTALFAKAFLPEGQMIFIDKGKTMIIPLRDFVARQKPGVVSERESRIVSIEIHENAATAHLELITPMFIFNDYMNLLKTADGWKIVNKIFHRQER